MLFEKFDLEGIQIWIRPFFELRIRSKDPNPVIRHTYRIIHNEPQIVILFNVEYLDKE